MRIVSKKLQCKSHPFGVTFHLHSQDDTELKYATDFIIICLGSPITIMIFFLSCGSQKKIVNHSIILKEETRLYREREKGAVASYCFKARKFAPLDTTRRDATG